MVSAARLLARAWDGRRGAAPANNCRSRLAVNTVDFFNAISMLYGMITESCTAQSCPSMCAGPKYEYRWADGVKARGPDPQSLGVALRRSNRAGQKAHRVHSARVRPVSHGMDRKPA